MVDMLEGDLLPRKPSILASIISVTFIGLGDLPKSWLRSMFRVRRQVVVLNALQWLKANNSRYYGDIKICDERLAELPEDDVPVEVMGVVWQSEETGVINQESEGYVSQDDGGHEELEPPVTSNGPIDSESQPDVIPLQISGTKDTDMSKLSSNELMLWGLANLWKEGKEGAYAVRHERQPVSTFGRSRKRPGSACDEAEQSEPECIPTGKVSPNELNFFERAFPCLYPYGCGGIEGYQPNLIDFLEHVRWSLAYHDWHFQQHETFPFVFFSIQQCCQALGSARVQMHRWNFEVDARILASITVNKLEAARREEEKGLPISDPSVRLLRQHVHATAGRVQDSDSTRYQMRSKIWATSIYMNPPSLWITINPDNLHNPIASVFAGEEIDLDRFIATAGPDKD
ncbi:uncharacterized protein PHACADRAFT_198176 [Phanerochaete carnosa HHB-10118-sp]|uniref:Uncharacterized protein n=1 Tax=Phanerochaete carnosa (strain HHB-10118-sp) TaxID=650164 RepID=K5W478_PHACS|nr:uncharacterized protein PHACADRAFT_198176 [Phanerochaete carnosa HHB-10118-sp]EKM53754.1 hypothetical protein PHACADRAFT_198176 [Phanerochaete carnosa HHB-10118-sp]